MTFPTDYVPDRFTHCLANQSKNNALAYAVFLATRSIFLSGVLPRVFLIAFKYTIPFLISTTTSFTEDHSQTDTIGWGLTGAWFLVFAGQAASFKYEPSLCT